MRFIVLVLALCLVGSMAHAESYSVKVKSRFTCGDFGEPKPTKFTGTLSFDNGTVSLQLADSEPIVLGVQRLVHSDKFDVWVAGTATFLATPHGGLPWEIFSMHGLVKYGKFEPKRVTGTGGFKLSDGCVGHFDLKGKLIDTP